MRKFSHVMIANRLADVAGITGTKRTIFVIGNVLPDCLPAFVIKRHKYRVALLEVRRLLVQSFKQKAIDYLRIGMVCHYVTDSFTTPHDDDWRGGIVEHCRWEGKLQLWITKNGKNINVRDSPNLLGEGWNLCNYLEVMHLKWKQKRSSLSRDYKFALCVCYQLLITVLKQSDGGIA